MSQTKLKVFIFGNDKSIKVKRVPVYENKAKIDKDWEVDFKPKDIFEHQAKGLFPAIPIWPLKNSYYRSIVVREGRSAAEEFNPQGDMFGPLTIQENASLIKRLIAKAKLSKPMTNLQILILLGIGAVVVLQIITLAGVRIA